MTRRWLLKEATAAAHARLDAAVSALDITTLEGYRRFLAASAYALVAVECALEAGDVERLLPDWPQRRRRHAILADLQGLSCAPPPGSRFEVVGDDAGSFGALYVLEGSRLGARVLLGRAMAAADARVRGNTRYLAHGAEERLWGSFVDRLESADPDLDMALAVAGAEAVFALFEQSFAAARGPSVASFAP